MGRGPQVEQGNLGVQEVVSEAPVLSFVMIRWDVSVRQGANPLLLMNPHIFSHTSATSPGGSSGICFGMGTPKDTQ